MIQACLALQSVTGTGSDPNLFHLDWDRTFEVVATIALVAVMIERALSLIFENRAFVTRLQGSPVKEVIAFAVSAAVCVWWHFDAVSTILLTDHTSYPGELITAAVVAGGSKGSVKLFRDVLGVRSTAYTETHGPPPRRPTHAAPPRQVAGAGATTVSASVQTQSP